MSSALRSVVVFAFVSALGVLSVPGCSQQGEGERCDSAKNGDADCDDGLTCVKQANLADQSTDRCCPAGNQETDKRCTPGTPGGNTGGTNTGGTNTGGSTAAGGEAGGGGVPAETGGGAPSSSGAPGTSDGGMSGGGGTPAVTDGGVAGADASAGTGGAG